MKSAMAWLSLLLFIPILVPYGAFVTKSAGNPDWASYATQPGSTYDAAANPAQTVGTVSYNPMAPLPQTSPPITSGANGAAGTTPVQ